MEFIADSLRQSRYATLSKFYRTAPRLASCQQARGPMSRGLAGRTQGRSSTALVFVVATLCEHRAALPVFKLQWSLLSKAPEVDISSFPSVDVVISLAQDGSRLHTNPSEIVQNTILSLSSPYRAANYAAEAAQFISTK
eukprot:GFKZ01003773.1.p1 GENE.GFKZ01003773.1~~GFKZ01003773.1.p1  ORF type:complete len:139 (+),score=5.74 GFKZ01003773.1:289-705(+)